MSIHGSAETSWPISAIGNSGASASGPTGSRVCGCRERPGLVGIDGPMLNQALGTSSSPSRILRGSAMGSSSSGSCGEQPGHRGGRIVGGDQGLADQDGVGAGGGGGLDAGAVADSPL